MSENLLKARLKNYCGLSTSWESSSVVLQQGEIGYETDTHKFKFGDGENVYSALGYPSNPVLENGLSDTTVYPLLSSNLQSWGTLTSHSGSPNALLGIGGSGDGKLVADKYLVGTDKVTMQYNSTDDCIEFVFS